MNFTRDKCLENISWQRQNECSKSGPESYVTSGLSGRSLFALQRAAFLSSGHRCWFIQKKVARRKNWLCELMCDTAEEETKSPCSFVLYKLWWFTRWSSFSMWRLDETLKYPHESTRTSWNGCWVLMCLMSKKSCDHSSSTFSVICKCTLTVFVARLIWTCWPVSAGQTDMQHDATITI